MAKAEIFELEPKVPIVEEKIRNMLIPKDPEDEKMRCLKFEEEREVMRRLFLQEIFLECTHAIAKCKI